MNFPFHAAKQILFEFQKRFIDDFDANAVAHELRGEGIIPDDVKERIVQNNDWKQRNAILHDYLQRTSTSESLKTVCNVALKFGIEGHPKMEVLSKEMKRRLEEGA